MHTPDDPNIRILAKEVGIHVAAHLQAKSFITEAVSPEYLTPQQTAQLIGFSLRALEAMRAKRTGPSFVKVGKAKNGPIRYHIEDVRAWMQAHREVSHVA